MKPEINQLNKNRTPSLFAEQRTDSCDLKPLASLPNETETSLRTFGH